MLSCDQSHAYKLTHDTAKLYIQSSRHLPLQRLVDTFVDKPVKRMQVVGDPGKNLPLFDAVQAIIDKTEGRNVGIEAMERFAFYEAARQCFVVVRTADPGPYGCFIVRMGVIDGAQ